jgi:hypothetical protein
VEYLAEEQKQDIIQEVLINRKPFPHLAINLSTNQQKKVSEDISRPYPAIRATGQLDAEGRLSEYYSRNTSSKRGFATNTATTNKTHNSSTTNAKINSSVLEKHKKDANDFWNGERRANNIRRNEWDLMDFYDQQEKVQCISMAGSLIDNH